MGLDYGNQNDMYKKLNGSLVLYRNSWVRVSVPLERTVGFTLFDVATKAKIASGIVSTDPDFDESLSRGRIRFVNSTTAKEALLVTRNAYSYAGYNPNNYNLVQPFNLFKHGLIETPYSDIADAIDGKFPTYQHAFAKVSKEGYSSWAFGKDFAFKRAGNFSVTLYYRDKMIGVYNFNREKAGTQCNLNSWSFVPIEIRNYSYIRSLLKKVGFNDLR